MLFSTSVILCQLRITARLMGKPVSLKKRQIIRKWIFHHSHAYDCSCRSLHGVHGICFFYSMAPLSNYADRENMPRMECIARKMVTLTWNEVVCYPPWVTPQFIKYVHGLWNEPVLLGYMCLIDQIMPSWAHRPYIQDIYQDWSFKW